MVCSKTTITEPGRRFSFSIRERVLTMELLISRLNELRETIANLMERL